MASDSNRYVEMIFDVAFIEKVADTYTKLIEVQLGHVPVTGTYFAPLHGQSLYLITAIIQDDMKIFAVVEKSDNHKAILPILYRPESGETSVW